MKDTFSKLHHDFSSVKSSESEKEDSYELEEKKKRRELGLKMLMSRDSSFGVTGLKVDSKSSMNKSLDDDSITNEKYQKQYSKRRKFVDDSEEE